MLCTFGARKNTLTMVALKLIGITVVLLGLGFAGIAIKIWAKKDGEFAGTCASQSPFLNKDGETCSYCGKDPNQCETKLEQAS
jgi:rRNA maturation endonuclease Nob1